MADRFVVGSTDTITGTIYDDRAGAMTALDLSGSTVVLKAQINGGASKSWTATPLNQSLYPGKYSYQLGSTDVDAAGIVEIQAHVAVGLSTFKSDIVRVDAMRSL
jgi:hypothetical protein